MKISIITTWMNGAADLLPDFARATEGAEVVIVDNGSQETDAAALKAFCKAQGGVYIRNEHNAGFAAANNQGYAAATGDVIVFLNSDIAGEPAWLWGVAADVKDGALYGPALQQQLVHGDLWPYLEGWCVAATRATWERVWASCDTVDSGPWDAAAYPGPYWEDNDLCLRATEAGVSLVQTAWPVQHKGGRTAGPLLRHGESFEANRATFARRVASHAAAKRGAPHTPTYGAYLQQCATPSDIQHHLPLLFSLAKGNVVELGTRSGVSTAALLAGVERHGGRVVSVDVDPASAGVAAGHPLWTFVQASSTDLTTRQKAPTPIDLLLIDTLHFYAHVAAEFAVWAGAVRPGGTICVHDTETFPGVRVAVEEFCQAKGWPVTFVRPCNGMAVVEVPSNV
jgi:glycosyltransferase involved in cell wall biosynthesis